METAKVEAVKEFPQEKELAEKTERLGELNATVRRTCGTPAGAGRRGNLTGRLPKESRLGYGISERGGTDRRYERKTD